MSAPVTQPNRTIGRPAMTTSRAAHLTELLSTLAALLAEPEKAAAPATVTKPRVLLTVAEAAERLGIGKTTTYALVRSGELESVLIGRLRRVHVDAVAAYAKRLVADQCSARN